MYRIKVTGYVQYLEPSDSLQDREYGKDFGHFKYVHCSAILPSWRGISQPSRMRESP
jgi:hypothetical protein